MSSERSLKYTCPKTRQQVETSIQTDDLTLVHMNRMTLSLWCPHCKDSHSVKASETFVHFTHAWKAA